MIQPSSYENLEVSSAPRLSDLNQVVVINAAQSVEYWSVKITG